ncbi:MAG: UDP-3-O-(3-hydroxymyristoyl)glucosamine N-acyltransferase [Armatimonadota bacterium]
MSENGYPLSKLASLINGKQKGRDVTITGVGTLDEASAGQIVFVENENLVPHGEESDAAALIVPPKTKTSRKPIIVTEDPRLAFSRVLELFAPSVQRYPGVHPTAIVEDGCTIDDDVSIGAHAYVGHNAILREGVTICPLAYVGENTVIEARTVIHPQVYIGERVVIGADSIIHAGAAIGADGFGFAQTSEGHKKIHQIGTVIIEDNVEIGANSTVDRATVTTTRIGAGTKIDDGVHVAHNVTMGKNCLLAGQVGIAGSATIGDNVVMGGQAGINDHISITDNVVIGGGAVVIGDIDEPGVYSGYPASRHGHSMRVLAIQRNLPEMRRQMKTMQERIEQLEKRLEEYEK